jgi:glycosyltransferase involved in cell wall biosynthesis
VRPLFSEEPAGRRLKDFKSPPLADLCFGADNSLHRRSTMPPDMFVIVTARDEADRIGATLAALALAFPGAPVWVADDGSADATPEIARDAGAQVVRSEQAIGKGGAATRAARDALRHAWVAVGDKEEKSIFILCDGDLVESAGELGVLAEAVGRGKADVAVAAFATRVGGGIGLAVAFARWAIRRRCGLRTKAPLSGQRALGAGALADVLPFGHGFGMEVGMTIDAVRAGHRVVEIELDLAHRATGRTPAGFAHRGRQLVDFALAYLARR